MPGLFLRSAGALACGLLRALGYTIPTFLWRSLWNLGESPVDIQEGRGREAHCTRIVAAPFCANGVRVSGIVRGPSRMNTEIRLSRFGVSVPPW